MNWNEMDPPERDALVAEKVMGWRHGVGSEVPEDLRHFGEPIADQEMWWDESGDRTACKFCGDLPSYTTSIADAWRVVERVRETWWDVQIHGDAGDDGYRSWMVGIDEGIGGAFSPHFRWDAEAETAPEAICLAALRSVGVQV